MQIINTSGLCKLAKDETYPSQAEGCLHIHWDGAARPKFQQHYAILKGNLLFAFNKKSDASPCRILLVDGYELDLCEWTSECVFRLMSNGDGKMFHEILAPSKADFIRWTNALFSCSYKELIHCSAAFGQELDNITTSLGRDPLVDPSCMTTSKPLSWPPADKTACSAPTNSGQSIMSRISKIEHDLLGKFYKKQ